MEQVKGVKLNVKIKSKPNIYIQKKMSSVFAKPVIEEVKPNKYILVSCRKCDSEENKILSKHFKNIYLYNSELNCGNTDISKMSFDLLILDLNKDAHHEFLEIIHPQCKALNIPIIVLKRSFCNSKLLIEALDASSINSIKDFDGVNFFNYLSKGKIPKLKSSSMCCLKAVLKVLSKA
jgi:hypothetical protein